MPPVSVNNQSHCCSETQKSTPLLMRVKCAVLLSQLNMCRGKKKKSVLLKDFTFCSSTIIVKGPFLEIA